MPYLPLNRFRGALLGAAIGEAVGAYYDSHPSRPHNLQGWLRSLKQDAALPLPWTTQVLQLGHHLATGLKTESGWVARALKAPVEQQSLTPSAAALMALPMALLFHDDPVAYDQSCQLLRSTARSLEAEVAIHVLGGAIATSFYPAHDAIDRLTVLLQWLDQAPHLQSAESQTSAQTLIQLVQSLLEERAGSERARQSLTTASQVSEGAIAPSLFPLAVALYCCWDTPDSFKLSVLRAMPLAQGHCALACALIGALSGSYNTDAVLPIPWRLALSQVKGFPGEQDWFHLAEQLWAAWAGIEQSSEWDGGNQQRPVVTAPRMF